MQSGMAKFCDNEAQKKAVFLERKEIIVKGQLFFFLCDLLQIIFPSI